jgi:hypothetical protein
LIEGESRTIRKKNGLALKASYLRDKLEPTSDKQWARELSGRVLSLAFDIREKAEKECQGRQGFRFRHLVYGPASSIRARAEYDVFLDEITGDKAHANLVLWKEPEPKVECLSPAADAKQPHEVYRHLAEKVLIVIPEAQLAAFEALRPDL